MAIDTYGAEQQTVGRGMMDDTEDLTGGGFGAGVSGPPAGGATATRSALSSGRSALGDGGNTLGESGLSVGEVAGDESVFVPATETAESEGELHQEVGSAEGAEAGEEYAEATAEQMASEAGEEAATADLRGIEGFGESDGGEAAEEAGPEAGQLILRDAGAATEGAETESQAEFFPILTALAPTLISSVGPMVARAVVSRLSPRARRVLARIAARTPVPIPARPGAGGGVTNILAVVAQLLQQAQQKGGRTGFESGSTESDGAQPLVGEAVAAIEAIVDIDDRVRISNTTQVPWRRICALRIQFPSGATYRGTGFLIGPRAVVTAGHCVYLHNQGGWARQVTVIPGSNGPAAPFGRVESGALRSVRGWVSGKRPESDYGCVVLPQGAFGGRNLGSFGFAAFDAQVLLAQRAVIAGFPADKPFAEMWGAARRLKAVTAKTLVYNTATMGGQSGAPVYIKRAGQRYAVGIHNYGSSTGNSATRITRSVLTRLAGWSKL